MGQKILRLDRSHRRATDWFSGPRGVLTFNSATLKAFATGVTNFQDGQTIVRTRGDLIIGLSATGGALEGFTRVAVGMCIVTTKASDIGPTAIPGPLTEVAWDGWFW